jgi:hypothetical protein
MRFYAHALIKKPVKDTIFIVIFYYYKNILVQLKTIKIILNTKIIKNVFL